MNFRTLIMLAVAALVIVIAVKMNRNPEPAMTEETVATEGYMGEETTTDGLPLTEEEAQDFATDAVDEVAQEPVISADDVDAGDMVEGADANTTVTEDGTVITEEEATTTETEATVGGQELTAEEAEAMEPAVVDESPAEALETGPAETISDEPVETPAQ